MQHNSSTLYIKIDEATHGSPLGVLSDPLQPRRCPLDHRLRSPDIRQGGSPGAPRSRPVDEDLSPSLAARPGSQDPACHSGPQNSDSRWSSQYSVSSRLSSPEAQPRGRESPPGPSATVRQPLSPSARYVVSCASLARSMTRRDKTRTATPRARSSKPNTLSPDPSGSPGPRQGSLRSRRHPDRARWIPPFRAQGPLRAVALLRTLST